MTETMTADRVASYVVEGGKALHGTVSVSGAKNAATKMLVASLLTDEPCTLHNTPRIGDVNITESLLRAIGTEMRWLPDHPSSIEIQTAEIVNHAPPQELARGIVGGH